MDIIYSEHARKRMKERSVEEWEIEHILQFPFYIKKSDKGTIEAYGRLRNRTLKIIYEVREMKGVRYKRIVSVQIP